MKPSKGQFGTEKEQRRLTAAEHLKNIIPFIPESREIRNEASPELFSTETEGTADVRQRRYSSPFPGRRQDADQPFPWRFRKDHGGAPGTQLGIQLALLSHGRDPVQPAISSGAAGAVAAGVARRCLTRP